MHQPDHPDQQLAPGRPASPEPPARLRATWRWGRVAAGFGLSVLGHALVGVAAILGNDPYHGLAGIGIFFLGQNVLVGVCIAASVTVIAKREAGIGAGLVAGWLIGGLALVVTLIVITRAGNPAAV